MRLERLAALIDGDRLLEVDLAGTRLSARLSLKALYDSSGERIKD